MKKIILSVLIFFPCISYADFAGLYLGAARWNFDTDGDIQNKGSLVDLSQDLDLKHDDSNYGFIAIEHPIPALPNLRVSRTEVELSSSTTLSRNIIFDDSLFLIDNPIDSQLDLSHTNFTLYYEILDNWVNLDIGLEAKHFDGSLSLTSNDLRESEDFDEYLPALYANAQFDLPFSGLHAGTTLSGIGFDDDKFVDMDVYLGWESESGFGSRLSYRHINISFDDVSDVYSDITMDGFQLTFYFHL